LQSITEQTICWKDEELFGSCCNSIETKLIPSKVYSKDDARRKYWTIVKKFDGPHKIVQGSNLMLGRIYPYWSLIQVSKECGLWSLHLANSYWSVSVPLTKYFFVIRLYDSSISYSSCKDEDDFKL